MMKRTQLLFAILFLVISLSITPAQNVQSYVIDQNPNTNGNDSLEKVVDFFSSGSVPSYILGQGEVNGSPGGMYLYSSADGVNGPFTKTTIAPHGSYYERSIAYRYPGDAYPGVIASVDRRLVWYQNPKNWGGDITQPWPSSTINRNAGCHDMKLADVDQDGAQDVVCSATNLQGTQSFIAFQNSPSNWSISSDATPSGDGIDMISINGSPRTNIVSCSGASLYWYDNPKLRDGNARTDIWNPHYIGGCNAGVSIAVGNYNGHDGVIVASNEGEPTAWAPGLVWYEPTANAYAAWTNHSIDSTYRDVHQINTGSLNSTPYFIVGEQEQACWGSNIAPPSHPNLPCRVSMFSFRNGGFGAPVYLSTNGTQNQATLPYNGGLLVAGANHHYYGGYPPFQAWFVNPGGGIPMPSFQAGSYAISDSSNWAIDGGFFYWSRLTNIEEWQQGTNNLYQQWNFQSSGPNYFIYSVGNGNSVALSDGSGTLQIGVGVDAWTVASSGSGYTIRNTRTGNYINDPTAQQGVVKTSPTPTVWSIHSPI